MNREIKIKVIEKKEWKGALPKSSFDSSLRTRENNGSTFFFFFFKPPRPTLEIRPQLMKRGAPRNKLKMWPGGRIP